jgi:hypothetical protein
LERFHPPGEPGVPEDAEGEALSTPLRERPDAPLGTLIFRAGLLPAETIESALEEGVKTGKRLGEILTERGLIKEADLARLLAGQKGLNYVTLREQIVDPAAAGLLSEDQARLFRALPYSFDEGVPVVAIADPTDDVLTRNVREALGRDDARFVVSVRSELAEIIGEVYEGGVAPAPAPAPAPVLTADVSRVPDTAGPGPGHVPSEPVEAHAPQAAEAQPVFEHPVPEPVGEAPVPETPTTEAPMGLTHGNVSEGLTEASPEPASNGHHEYGAVAPDLVLAAQPAPIAVPAPEPVTEPVAPEPVAAEPMAAAEPAPVQPAFPVPAPAEPSSLPALASAQPAPEPDPTPTPVAQAPAVEVPAPTPEPPAVASPEPVPAVPAGGQAHKLMIRLANGERVDVGAYGDLEAAKTAAKALMAQIGAADGGDWPFVSGRFLKPDSIVSVDIS